ncbi:MAG: carbamoyltransferase N-terminal domain-containing protein, partial [Candidatus Margulisiibacteriota bacterium]
MRILGICSDVWISSAAIIEDGKIIAAIPEERLNRQKIYRGFPRQAIEYCLRQANCSIEDL